MVTAQIIKNCLEELTVITKVEFCLQDTAGTLIAKTPGAVVPDAEGVSVFAASAVDSQIIGDHYYMKIQEEEEVFYILTAIGSGENTLMVARIAVSEIRNLMSAYREKYDRSNFFQNLLLDNLLPVDVRTRARKLHITQTQPRAVILLDIAKDTDSLAEELLGGLFTAHNGDYLAVVDESSVIVIKSVRSEEDYETLEHSATVAVDMLSAEAMLNVRAAYGTIVSDLQNLSKSYKEARMAMDVGRIFYAGKRVNSYNELGIGRLIYQLPSNLCNIFIHEIFGDNVPDHLDNETLTTINAFLENSLNVSETSRKLFIHRNTLVYRIEKLARNTGLDIRNFDDAMTFKIALMVLSYLKYLSRKDY